MYKVVVPSTATPGDFAEIVVLAQGGDGSLAAARLFADVVDGQAIPDEALGKPPGSDAPASWAITPLILVALLARLRRTA